MGLDVVCLTFRGATLGGATLGRALGLSFAEAMAFDVALACPLGLSLSKSIALFTRHVAPFVIPQKACEHKTRCNN